MARAGKPRGVFHAVEAFFFDRGDQVAVDHNGRCGVGVIRVNSENDHRVLDAAARSVATNVRSRSRVQEIATAADFCSLVLTGNPAPLAPKLRLAHSFST